LEYYFGAFTDNQIYQLCEDTTCVFKSVSQNESNTSLKYLLSKYWGASSFREGQRAAIDAIQSRKDCLLVLPTGGGKSLCYQLPALLANKTVVVVSPLIALMLDQVADLSAKGIPAVSLGGDLTKDRLNQVIRQCDQGVIKLLYISPERLQNSRIRDFLSGGNAAFLVVDEAHCISQWGHQFRPEYRKISSAFGQDRSTPIIAVTATATPKVQNDICKNLELDDPVRLIHSHDRPNLFWKVVKESSRKLWIEKYFKTNDSCGIVYVATRKNAEALSRYLTEAGISSRHYHAGMESHDRFDTQESFLRSRFQVVVATSAFGMGINKPDVRAVIHYDFPLSFEEYVQQAGRAGRDGLNASAILLYDENAVLMQKKRQGRNTSRFQRLRSSLDREKPNPRSQLLQIEKYAQLRSCRRRDILFYFGEKASGRCGNCDVCLGVKPPRSYSDLAYRESEGELVQRVVGELSASR